MTYEKLAAKLDRKNITIQNHVAREPGVTMNNKLAQHHVDTLTAMIEQMKELGGWEQYCAERGMHPGCDAYDYYA
ncbi:MAG: hypothetical protein N0C84_00650 [Candidatus Thiodiazotropha taylori]|uniref:Uncharacterized protein n=1 Tax=Candidatus Thiodiazotropha taylori TaxID=2792791 RepID=A0A9E4K972_9GAMM|nr:hypothetical protein [Candidatus Thiodiazotropha taylori]MCW4254954.1 hypothetical protein [Candidatus Thiodiazotropha taylori]